MNTSACLVKSGRLGCKVNYAVCVNLIMPKHQVVVRVSRLKCCVTLHITIISVDTLESDHIRNIIKLTINLALADERIPQAARIARLRPGKVA
jgi:hypothetical protein